MKNKKSRTPQRKNGRILAGDRPRQRLLRQTLTKTAKKNGDASPDGKARGFDLRHDAMKMKSKINLWQRYDDGRCCSAPASG